ncbi:hypothetical protein DAPPUDRAFT_198141, partial [Daphnia pulex]
MERVDAGIELKKKSIATKPFDKESIQQRPEATPFQQEYQIESIRKDQPEAPTHTSEMLLNNVAVVEQKKETIEPLNLKSVHSIEPALVTKPSTQVFEDAVEVSKIEIKKKPKVRKAEISLASESVVVEQPDTTAQLELKAEMTLPVDIQPEEPKSVKIESVQVSEDVIPAKDIEIKKKSRIRKTEISLASDSAPTEQVETVEQLKIKSEITLPTDIKHLEPVPVMTESVTVQETSVKHTIIKNKPQIKAKQQLAPEIFTAQQPEETEQLELKSEIMVPSHAKPEEFKQEMAEPQQEVVTIVEKKKIPRIVKKKKKPVTEDTEESVTIQATKTVDQVEEGAATFKLKPKISPEIPVEDVEEEYVIKKPKETVETVEESTLLTLNKSVIPYQVEEIEDSVNVASIRKVEPVAVEDVEQGATLKLKQVKVIERENVEEQFQIGLKPVKPKEQVEDVEEKLTIKPKRKTSQSVEEASASLKTVVQAEDVTLKMVQKEEVPYQVEEIEEEIQVKPIIKKKKTKVVAENVESGEQFQIGLKPVKPKEQVEDVEEKLTIKPKRKTSQAVEEASASLKTIVQAEDVPQDVTLKMVQKKEIPYRVEEIEDEFQVKPILKKKKKVVDQDVESGATLKLKEQVVTVDEAEDVEEQFQIGLKPKRKPKVQIQIDDVEGEAAVTLKRPAKSVVIEETTEAASLVIQQKQPVDDDSLLTTTDQSSESVTQKFSDKEFSLGLKPRRLVKPSISVEADESLRFKIPARPKVSAPTLTEDGNTLTVARAATSILADAEEETTMPLEPQEGDEFFSLCSYVADTEEAMNLVEGERVYVLEWHNSDWWFVRKHLTEETGWVPAQYLKDDTSYTHYVKKKLDEKINKLPVFDFPTADETKIQAPRFLTKLQPVRAPDGSSITFECQVEGSPRPVITWFRQTAVIKPSLDFQMVYDEEGNMASLTIAEVFPEDAGTFTCVAKNSAGFASSSAELIVEAPLSDHGSDTTITSRRSLSRESSLMDILEGIPPTFSQRPKTKTVDEGTDVELECRLVAVPEPDVAWFHNGKRIKPSDRIALLGQSDVHMYC